MKKSLIYIGLVVIVAATIFASTLYHSLVPDADSVSVSYVADPVVDQTAVANVGISSTPVATPSSELLPSSHPSSILLIPSLKVNAKIEKVGINSKGNITSPTTFQTVGWYKNGTVPGQVGSAIIDGHVDNGLGLKGVFINLKNIKIGDIITVVDERSHKYNFKVEATTSLDYKSRLSDLNNVSSNSTEANKSISRLVLLTCDGDWIKEEKTYDKRIVVIANLVTSG